MTGEKYKSDTKLTPQFKMLYCMLKAANKEAFKFNYDEFIDTLDENQDSVQKFFDYITELSDKKKVVESQ
jgi:cobyrinic acid a,c-diamide synthase